MHRYAPPPPRASVFTQCLRCQVLAAAVIAACTFLATLVVARVSARMAVRQPFV